MYDNDGSALKGTVGPGRAGSVSSWAVAALRSQGLEPGGPGSRGSSPPPARPAGLWPAGALHAWRPAARDPQPRALHATGTLIQFQEIN